MQLTKNFSKAEFDSKDGFPMPTQVLENVKIVAKNLQVLRDYFGKKITINSGYRSPQHNARLRGAVSNSQHIYGRAADIVVQGEKPEQVAQAIEQLIAQGKMQQGGLAVYDSFVHYDTRGTKARWDYRIKKK